jgi:two-component system response regulator GlrR
MATPHCIVLDLLPASSTGVEAAAVLGAMRELRAMRATEVDAVPADADLVLVIASNDCTPALHTLHRRLPSGALIVVGAEAAGERLLQWLGGMVHDFLRTPLVHAELAARVRRALGLLPAARHDGASCQRDKRLRDFIGSDPQFVRQVERLPAIAVCDAGVLIFGETGTGKEVCAQAVHYLSPRAARPWVAVNCGAIPTELLESELFGHVRGAYTAAHASREGLVREAEGGTLFLDDVDCLPLAAQTKLLRFLQEKEYRQVGANALHKANVRVIAASNRSLEELAGRGQFRQDLFYRLNVLNLSLPPLRARRGDIPELALHFARQCARAAGRPEVTLTPAALRRLAAHDWPGNVRELKHLIDRAVLLATGPAIGPADLELGGEAAAPLDEDSFQAAKARLVADFERGYIEQLLRSHRGNVTHAAQAARKNRRAFFELMRKHQIEPVRFRIHS